MNVDSKKNQDAKWGYKAEEPQEKFSGDQVSQPQIVSKAKVTTVKWTASEYIATDKNSSWFFILFGAGAVTVLIVWLITQDILASSVILLAITAMSVYANRKPETKSYEIDDKGVKINDKFIHYRDFRSYSMVEEGALDSVWLKPLKRLSPTVVMYYSPEDEAKIADTLSNFLPHEQRELDFIDRASRKMKF